MLLVTVGIMAAGVLIVATVPTQGAWTAEEDAALAHLVEQHGAKWKRIGDAMGRLPDSCRDRWRSYIKPGVFLTSAFRECVVCECGVLAKGWCNTKPLMTQTCFALTAAALTNNCRGGEKDGQVERR